MSEGIEGLVEDGYVRRVDDPTDRRAVIVELTDKGAAELQRVGDLMTAELIKRLDRLTAGALVRRQNLLAEAASLADMLWFLTQEVAGEAGFDDLLALTQVKMPVTAKLEMARNYWDEMGRGRDAAMHGPLLERLASYLEIDARPELVVPESLALGNAMLALARSRRYCFHSIGALGVIEMTAPTRACFVDAGLKRLRIPAKKRLYFTLHAVLDIKHSECWNREVLRSLVERDARCANAIAEGAVIRLWHGARCFDRYRRHFAFDQQHSQAA